MQDLAYIEYNKITEDFNWIKSQSNSVKLNSIAGTKRKDGYIVISFNHKNYLAHRLAWFFINVCMPSFHLDHIDENKSNNKIENLKGCTTSENLQNVSNPPKNNKSGFIGVSWCKRTNKWRSTIKVDKKQKFIGYFDNIEIAKEAYLSEKRKVHNFWVEK